MPAATHGSLTPGATFQSSWGVNDRSVRDWFGAGALSAGVGTLLAGAFMGLGRLGYLEWPHDFDATFVFIIATSVLCGATLGHRQPAGMVPRLVAAFVVGSALAAGLVGISYVPVRFIDIPERRLPPFFLIAGILLVGVGVRRLPRRPWVRVVLAVPLVLAVTLRVLASVPPAAHAIERRLFPLTGRQVRTAWDKHACGPFCRQGRARVVAVEQNISYRAGGGTFMQAEARVRATVEATKPFVVDGCGHAHDKPPLVAPTVSEFKTTAACVAVRPRLRYEWNTHIPDPACCAVESVERHPGDRFDITRSLEFTFFRGSWKSDDDS